MKKILVIAALSLALPAYGILYTGNSDYTSQYVTDQYTAGLWHFNECTGDTLVADASGNSPDGTLETFSGDPGLDPNSMWQTSAVPYSGFGNMISTTSDSKGRIEVPGNEDTQTGTNPLYMGPNQDLTIEFWMKYDGNFMDPGQTLVMSKWSSDYIVHGYYWPAWYNETRISIGWHNDWAPSGSGPDTGAGSTDGYPMVIGEWTHFMFCVDRTSYVPPNPWDPMMHTAMWFINGEMVQSQTTDNIMSQEFAGEVQLLGRSWDDRGHYVGDIDEFRISSCLRLPEPSMLSLLAIALGARVLRRRKK